MANISITMGNHARALPYWMSRAAHASDLPAAAQAGALLLALNDLGAAEAMLRRAAVPGVLPEAWNNLGVALARRGRLNDARACFEEALRQFPAYRDARLNMASASPQLITERLLRPINQILR
jgi:Flp pilus assembly protein TadD